MCKDFVKSLKENIFTIILWIINLCFGFVSYVYANDTKKLQFIILLEKISIALATIFSIFKARCSYKSKDIIEKVKDFEESLSNGVNLIEGLKADGIKDKEQIINGVRNQIQKLVNIVNNL